LHEGKHSSVSHTSEVSLEDETEGEKEEEGTEESLESAGKDDWR
jgi:hypothetical protein